LAVGVGVDLVGVGGVDAVVGVVGDAGAGGHGGVAVRCNRDPDRRP
jgi:hypothetical protein